MPVEVESRGARARVRRAVVLARVLVALIPVIPVVAGMVLLGTTVSHAPTGSVMRPVKTASPPASPIEHLSKTPPRRLAAQLGSQVAVVLRPTAIRTSPNGPAIAPQPTTTPFGSPVAYLVRQVRGGWLGVVSPLAGNGRLGWIPASAASLGTVDWKLEVSLTRRLLTVVHGDRVLQHYRIAIGTPSAPTPTGIFAVTDRLSTGDPLGPYGCCILALSALAPHAIQDWSGGNRIAIHSTPPDTYWSIGDAISHGCIHVTLPQGRWLLDHIPLGTPAIIRSD